MPKSSGILFCGGGTGGHVLPGLAVADALRADGPVALRWIGDPQRIEARLVPAAGISLLPFGLSRPRPWNPHWLMAAAGQAWACFRELSARPPRVVVALGGYAALLPGLMAPLMRRPLVVMEQNARAGRTNKLLARFADRVVTQFPEARRGLPSRKVRQLGNPVRAIGHARRGTAPRLRVLVVGGSLAAKSLNDLVVLAAARLAALPISVVHLAGEQDRGRVVGIYAAAGTDAEVHGYFHDMPALYQRIDVAVTRAGATTVAELCAAGIPALYIPLPWAADDHQSANARAVERVGGAVVMAQSAASPDQVTAVLERFAADRALVARMGEAARRLARPYAAAQVADLVRGLDPLARRRRRRQARADARGRFAILASRARVSAPRSAVGR